MPTIITQPPQIFAGYRTISKSPAIPTIPQNRPGNIRGVTSNSGSPFNSHNDHAIPPTSIRGVDSDSEDCRNSHNHPATLPQIFPGYLRILKFPSIAAMIPQSSNKYSRGIPQARSFGQYQQWPHIPLKNISATYWNFEAIRNPTTNTPGVTPNSEAYYNSRNDPAFPVQISDG